MTLPATRPRVEIYTDGGCDPNPGSGGWGAVLRSGPHHAELSGYAPTSTNNRMELTAAIEALSVLKEPSDVDLYTDSQYLQRGISEWLPGWVRRGWVRANGRPVENADLWKELVVQAERHTINWRWLRGHQGHRWNERADALATRALRSKGKRLEQAGRQSPNRDKAWLERPQAAETEAPDLRRYDLYCRACALGSGPAPAGYAALLVGPDGGASELLNGSPRATADQMHLEAAIAGLRALPEPSTITIHIPSKYVIEGATRWLGNWERNGWRTTSGGSLKNRELWLELALAMGDHDVRWVHLQPDAGQRWSDLAADLARQQAESQRGPSAGA